MDGSAVQLDAVDAWIRREAIAFTLSEAASLNAAVDRAVEGLGSEVELLGLGEPTHGVDDFLRFRNAVFQRLVERHGYSAIAMESSFPRGHVVNDYVLGRGTATSFDEIVGAGFSHGFGRMATTRELVEWMRAYNSDASHARKVRFYGFDSPTEMTGADSPRQLLGVALDFLSATDAASGAKYRERIEPLVGDDAAWENPAAAFDPSQSIGLSANANALRIATEDLISELSMRRPEFVGQTDASRFAQAMHQAVHARQMLNYHALLASQSPNRIAECLGLRDAMMGDNLAYIVEHERDVETQQAKVFAFAHNSHLKRGRAEWKWGARHLVWWPAGAQVHEKIGSRYAVIGVGLGTSKSLGVGEPEAGSIEARMVATPGPARIVRTPQRGTLSQAAVEGLPTRAGTQSYFPFTAQSLDDFDALVVLDVVA